MQNIHLPLEWKSPIFHFSMFRHAASTTTFYQSLLHSLQYLHDSRGKLRTDSQGFEILEPTRFYGLETGIQAQLQLVTWSFFLFLFLLYLSPTYQSHLLPHWEEKNSVGYNTLDWQCCKIRPFCGETGRRPTEVKKRSLKPPNCRFQQVCDINNEKLKIIL